LEQQKDKEKKEHMKSDTHEDKKEERLPPINNMSNNMSNNMHSETGQMRNISESENRINKPSQKGQDKSLFKKI